MRMRFTGYSKVVNWALPIVLVLLIVPTLLKIFVCDRFTVNGPSMQPTYTTGEHVWVNKLVMGARIYKKYDFQSPDLSCFRMPGLRSVREGDILVFNYPQGWEKGKIGFKINYVYCKRCIGTPGDTVSVRSGYYYNNSHLCAAVPENNQRLLSYKVDSLVENHLIVLRALASKRTGWTIRDFGPMVVPRKGTQIRMDAMMKAVYKKEIEYETGRSVKELKDSMYCFQSNWYFVGGDNVLDSRDSRYFGLVPEDYIIGVATK